MILGTAQLGMKYGIHNRTGKPAEETAFQILDYSWKHGVTALDTAKAYGDSQYLIGRYQEATRHSFRICTKTVSGTAEGLESELKESLSILKCSRIWLYYLHRFESCKDKGVIRELERAKAQGRISNIGISVYEPQELEYIAENLSELTDIVQIPFHLLDYVRWQKADLLRRAKEKNIQIFAMSIFLQGLFFLEPDSKTAEMLYASEVLEELRRTAEVCSVSMQQLAVSFVLSQPYIDEILLGCETAEQLEHNIALTREAGRKKLSADTIYRINEISARVNEITIDPRKWKGRA